MLQVINKNIFTYNLQKYNFVVVLAILIRKIRKYIKNCLFTKLLIFSHFF